MFINNIDIRKPILAIIPFFIIIAFGVSSINACPPPPDCDTPDRYVMWAKRASLIVAQSERNESVFLDYYSAPHTVKYILVGQNNIGGLYFPFVSWFDYSYGTSSPECGNCTAKNSTFSRSGGDWVTNSSNTYTIEYPKQVLAGNVRGTHNGWDCNKDGYGSYIIDGGSQITMDVYVVKVDIKRDGVSIVANDPTVSVGEKISLTGTVEPSAVNALVTDKQWSIQGGDSDRISNYIAMKAIGRVVKLDPPLLLDTSVNYYWVTGGDNRQNSYTVDIGSFTFGADSYFHVKRPTSGITTVTTFTTAIHTTNAPYTVYLAFKDNTNAVPGIVFNKSNYSSNGAVGNTSWIQKVNHCKLYAKDINNVWTTLVDCTKKLDTTLPYATTPSTQDSPELQRGCIGLETDISFSMWLMFKPNTANSIYVPIAKVNWYWKAKHEKINQTWPFSDDFRDCP